MTVDFEVLEDDRGIRVRDAAEGEQFALRTDRAVDPAPASPDEFVMPVESAVAVEAGELHAPLYETATFHRDGEAVLHTDGPETTEVLDRDTYEVGLSIPGAKTYVKVCDAAVAARYTDDHLYLDVDPATRLVVGVRSHHRRPAATVTTTDDPRDLMTAVSTFGSALKTHTPDRSWPTLRGHPPSVRRGDRLEVPDAAAPPDTGVTVDVPPEYGAVFAVAPLAYYLGATVEPARQPRLRAAGAVREFDPDDLAADVRAVLEHVFTLDGVVRTVGVYPFRHEQADAFDDRVDVDYDRLFDLPLDERTAAYLDVPRSATRGLVDWHLTADVAADPAYAPALPHLVDELALVRSPARQTDAAALSPSPNAVTSPDADGVLARSLADTPADPTDVVVPDPVDTPGHVWVADGFAAGAANPTVGSYRRGFDWPSGTDPLDVHVVYNDARIDDPEVTPYGGHPTAETNVRVSHSLTTSELRDALHEETDFLHFVGHVTDAGMVCPDGELDTRTLATTGVAAFFLNGCRSYAQGRALLTAGAVGGIVTVDDVADTDASSAGRQVAMLLDAGYPLYGILDVLDRVGRDAGRYSILGDGTLALRRHSSGVPTLYSVESGNVDLSTDAVPVTTKNYPVGENGLGTMFASNYTVEGNKLGSAVQNRTSMPLAEFDRYLSETTEPHLFDGDLRRPTALSLADFR
ncbi:MAG: hypothetical protein ABEJ90_04950 [Halobacterium sp.]